MLALLTRCVQPQLRFLSFSTCLCVRDFDSMHTQEKIHPAFSGVCQATIPTRAPDLRRTRDIALSGSSNTVHFGNTVSASLHCFGPRSLDSWEDNSCRRNMNLCIPPATSSPDENKPQLVEFAKLLCLTISPSFLVHHQPENMKKSDIRIL